MAKITPDIIKAVKEKFITITIQNNIRFRNQVGGKHDVYCEDIDTVYLKTGIGELLLVRHIKKIEFTPK